MRSQQIALFCKKWRHFPLREGKKKAEKLRSHLIYGTQFGNILCFYLPLKVHQVETQWHALRNIAFGHPQSFALQSSESKVILFCPQATRKLRLTKLFCGCKYWTGYKMIHEDCTLLCRCENINCPFCNLLMSIEKTDPNVLPTRVMPTTSTVLPSLGRSWSLRSNKKKHKSGGGFFKNSKHHHD